MTSASATFLVLDDRIDIDTLGEMAELLQEEFSAVLEAYLEDTNQLMQGAYGAIANEDMDALASAAHQIKSSSAYLGMVKLSELAGGLEQRCGEARAEGIGEIIAELDAEFEFVCEHVMSEFGVELS